VIQNIIMHTTTLKEREMRPEIAAYMIEAAVEIAKEQGFSPANENEVGCWMMNNREAIVTRAIDIQRGILDRRDNREAMRALSTILSAQVWLAANRNQVNELIQTVTGGSHA
jgi:hypothetical protein